MKMGSITKKTWKAMIENIKPELEYLGVEFNIVGNNILKIKDHVHIQIKWTSNHYLRVDISYPTNNRSSYYIAIDCPEQLLYHINCA